MKAETFALYSSVTAGQHLAVGLFDMALITRQAASLISKRPKEDESDQVCFYGFAKLSG
eukprot:IDg14901t1